MLLYTHPHELLRPTGAYWKGGNYQHENSVWECRKDKEGQAYLRSAAAEGIATGVGAPFLRTPPKVCSCRVRI